MAGFTHTLASANGSWYLIQALLCMRSCTQCSECVISCNFILITTMSRFWLLRLIEVQWFARVNMVSDKPQIQTQIEVCVLVFVSCICNLRLYPLCWTASMESTFQPYRGEPSTLPRLLCLLCVLRRPPGCPHCLGDVKCLLSILNAHFFSVSEFYQFVKTQLSSPSLRLLLASVTF